MMPSHRIQRSLRDIWPRYSDLINDFKVASFEVGSSTESIDQISQSWDQLRCPKSFTATEVSKKDFTYVQKTSHLKKIQPQDWGLILADTEISEEKLGPGPFLRIQNADAAMDFLLKKIVAKEWAGAESSKIPPGVIAEPNVHIGPDCQIEEGVILESGVRIGARVKIGAGTRIGANSRIGDDCVIGRDCYFSALVSIGNNGFGLVAYPQSPIPVQRVHAGRVFIGDSVRLGALVAVDRGVFEDTVIGSLSQVDNIVQIAHNCKLGQVNIICGMVGLAGSTILSDFVTVGGMVAFKGHLSVGEGAQIGGFSGVNRDVAAGAQLRGIPARPVREDLRLISLYEKLPEIQKTLKELTQKT